MTFVPEGFIVPEQWVEAGFQAFVLTEAWAALDWEAIESGRAHLRGTFSGPWPDDVESWEDNLHDVRDHHNDFLLRQGFTYTVLDLAHERCLGCIYIYPSTKDGYDAAVYWWVRADVLGTPFVEGFAALLEAWVRRAFPFQRVAYPGRAQPWQGWLALTDAAWFRDRLAVSP